MRQKLVVPDGVVVRRQGRTGRTDLPFVLLWGLARLRDQHHLRLGDLSRTTARSRARGQASLLGWGAFSCKRRGPGSNPV